MSALELIWKLDISDNKKYLLIIIGIICLCVVCSMIPKKKKQEMMAEVPTGQPKTKCQSEYDKCQLRNKQNNTKDFCYPCFQNGQAPDFFFDSDSQQWIKSTV